MPRSLARTQHESLGTVMFRLAVMFRFGVASGAERCYLVVSCLSGGVVR